MEHSTPKPRSQPTFAVLGVGAVGGLYGAMLARSGYDVHFLARSDYAVIKQQGLTVDTPTGRIHIQPNIYESPDQMPQVDCVIVAWKTTANSALERILPHFASADPIVLMLQNGLNIESAAATIVGPENVWGGCCFLCSNRIAPGHIHHLDYGRIAIGPFGQRTSTRRVHQVANALIDAGIEIQLSENLAEIRWKKLAWNIPFNGLSVALDSDTQAIMSNPSSAALARSLMIEVAKSAAACGITIGADHIEKMLNDTRSMVPYSSSMLLDYQAARPMELEAIFGNPIHAALSAGYLPEKIELLYQQLQFLDTRNRIQLKS